MRLSKDVVKLPMKFTLLKWFLIDFLEKKKSPLSKLNEK